MVKNRGVRRGFPNSKLPSLNFGQIRDRPFELIRRSKLAGTAPQISPQVRPRPAPHCSRQCNKTPVSDLSCITDCRCSLALETATNPRDRPAAHGLKRGKIMPNMQSPRLPALSEE